MFKHYVYLDRQLIDEYSSQLGVSDKGSLAKISSKASVSLTGPKLESVREYIYGDSTLDSKIAGLMQILIKARAVTFDRPREIRPSNEDEIRATPFVLESAVATKVTFLDHHLKELRGVQEFAVWISDPNPEDPVTEPWVYRGAFLLLPQLRVDDSDFQSTHSGCSALQAVMNMTTGKSLLIGVDGEPLGRGSHMHPVEKLRQLGGVVSVPQRIRTLYRIRYMTNEQCYERDGKKYRVNDLMGYPLFISVVPPNESSNSSSSGRTKARRST